MISTDTLVVLLPSTTDDDRNSTDSLPDPMTNIHGDFYWDNDTRIITYLGMWLYLYLQVRISGCALICMGEWLYPRFMGKWIYHHLHGKVVMPSPAWVRSFTITFFGGRLCPHLQV